MTITEYLNKQPTVDDAAAGELKAVVEAVCASAKITRGLELYLTLTRAEPLDSMTLSFSAGFKAGQEYAEIHQLEELMKAKGE